MNLIDKMERADLFTATENEIISFIQANKDRVLKMSIQDLAQETFTSNAAIVRLCRKLGQSGFREFKVNFAQDLEKARLKTEPIDVNLPFDSTKTPNDIALQIANLSISSIRSTYKNLDLHILNQAAQMLSKARNIYIFGTGDSKIRCESFANKLLKIGKFVLDAGIYREYTTYATSGKPEDVALYVSYSATNPDYIRSAFLFKSKQVPIIVITAADHTTLTKLADYLITFPDYEDELDSIATFYSQTCFEYILNVLYSQIFSFQFHENRIKKNQMDQDRLKSTSRAE